jgi:hypothetical protein
MDKKSIAPSTTNLKGDRKMIFEFEINNNDLNTLANCDAAYSFMLKFYQYKECLKIRDKWLESQNSDFINKYLTWFCRKENINDPEIRNYELAFMASWLYHHLIIDKEQLADLFIRRYSRFKGYLDTGISFEEACQKDFQDAEKFEPSRDLLLLQGRAFADIDNEVIKTAYNYIEKYAHLYCKETEIFKQLLQDIFPIFNDKFRNLFTDADKMIMIELDKDESLDEISYIPEAEEEMEGESIYILCAPNLIANTLSWYDGNFTMHIVNGEPIFGIDDEDYDDEDDD